MKTFTDQELLTLFDDMSPEEKKCTISYTGDKDDPNTSMVVDIQNVILCFGKKLLNAAQED